MYLTQIDSYGKHCNVYVAKSTDENKSKMKYAKEKDLIDTLINLKHILINNEEKNIETKFNFDDTNDVIYKAFNSLISKLQKITIRKLRKCIKLLLETLSYKEV